MASADACPCSAERHFDADSEVRQFEWEERDENTPFVDHAIAGSCAGVMEHLSMYPIDTVKTQMQASSMGSQGVRRTVAELVRSRGLLGLFRGSTAIGAGCVPAHVGLFGTYELARDRLMDPSTGDVQPIAAAAAGAAGTVVHDMIITPADVVKQRMQLGLYGSAMECYGSIWVREGPRAFYLSLPATLAMNIPYTGLLVASNEVLKEVLHLGETTTMADAPGYFFSAGVSGAFAGALTLPFDVVKTRLQTQGGVMRGPLAADVLGVLAGRSTPVLPYTGIWSVVRAISREEGFRGFFRGITPRVMLAMPSAAMCWGTYESVRTLLRLGRAELNPRPRHVHHHHVGFGGLQTCMCAER